MNLSSISILIGILLLFPVAVIILGEISLSLRSKGLACARSVDVIRNVLLPLLAIYLLIINVGNFSQEGSLSKLFLTAGIIIGLVAIIGVINGVLFERQTGNKVPKLFLDLGRILVVIIGIAATLSLVWGYDLENLITALGVSSIVLGLALQDTLGNLFNGITLINERPFQVGDFIEVDGLSGKVVEVNWRAVRLLTRERDLIVLPHIKVSQSAIMNHSRPEEHWAQKVMIGFSYDAPPNFVKRVMLEVCAATPEIMSEPVPEVKVDDFADSAVVYEIEYYISNFGLAEDVKNDFMTRVWYAAKRNGIEIPYPQVNVHREPQVAKEENQSQRDHDAVAFAISVLNIPEEIERLHDEPTVRVYSFGEGETILYEKTNEPGLYLQVNGEIQLTTRSEQGEVKNLSDLQRGDFITQLLLPGSRQNAISAIAVQDVDLVYFPEPILRRLVNRYPSLATQIEEVMATRSRQLSKIR